jgi:PAS domain S-box-containing protein
MNKLLHRQLVKEWGSIEQVPVELLPFLEIISHSYDHQDKDRTMLERSIDISSNEMIELNERLRQETRELEKAHMDLKTLFDNIETVFFTVDMIQYRLVQMSASCSKIYGYGPDDFLNNPSLWFEVIAESDKHIIESNYPLMHAGKKFSHSHRIVAKDGTIRWVETKITPTLNSEQTLIRIDGITTDITAKKQAEEESLRQEARYRKLIEKSHDGIALLGRDGNLLYVSPSVNRIMGYVPEELVGTDPSELIHTDDRQWLLVLLSEIVAQPGESKRATCRVKNKANEWRWIITTITNLLHDKSVNALVFNYRDITGQINSEQQIEFDRCNRDAMINSTSDLIWSFDTEINLITANKAFLKAYKKTTGIDIKPGDQLLDDKIFPPTFLSKWKLLYSRVLSGESFVCENHESISGEQWAELSWNPIIENNIVVGGSCSWHDITDKKHQSERLITSERMMAEAQRISKSGSWELYFNSHDEIMPDSVIWSREVYRIYGYDPDSHVPNYNDHHLLVHNEDDSLVTEWFESLLRFDSPGTIDHRIITERGVIKWVRTKADLICNPTTGARIKLVGTIQDITERKSLELQRAEAIEDLVQRNKDLQQFAHIVSHNLRAPVANIMGLAHLLRLSESDKHTHDQCVGGLAISAQRLDDIIKDLNNILQVKRGMTEDKMVVRFENLVQNISDSIQLQINQAEAVINTNFSEVAEMYTIKNYLHSVFYNLISNSIKYRRRNVKPVIEISSRTESGKTILSFRDNCMGIDLERYRDQVFGLYKRFHEDADGKGLGMYMVKSQVESLGGKIGIESRVNEGTEITIEFAAAS